MKVSVVLDLYINCMQQYIPIVIRWQPSDIWSLRKHKSIEIFAKCFPCSVMAVLSGSIKTVHLYMPNAAQKAISVTHWWTISVRSELKLYNAGVTHFGAD